MKRRNRPPTHPGMILRQIIEQTEGLTQDKLAHQIGVSFQTINMIVNQRRAVTADVAVRLARRFEMTAHFWLNMQNAVDLYAAEAALETGSPQH